MQLTYFSFDWTTEKYFEVIENVKKLDLKVDWAESRLTIYLLRQSQTNIWSKIEKTNKTGKEKKNSSIFSCLSKSNFLTGDWVLG